MGGKCSARGRRITIVSWAFLGVETHGHVGHLLTRNSLHSSTHVHTSSVSQGVCSQG